MKRLSILFTAICGLLLIALPARALIGVPCDPVKDFPDVYLIAHWNKLPHLNQEESKAKCDAVNKKLGKKAWIYKPKPNTPIYECLSYGSAGIANWWAAETGQKLGKYRSYANGRIERGFNPRKLELRYRKMAKRNPIQFAETGIMKGNRCPITGEWVPIRPSGFARLLVNAKADKIKDPIDGITFNYTAKDYPMEKSWFSVVSKNNNKKGVEAKLKKALKNYGPLFIQFEIPGKHFLFGTHAVVVIGYATLPNKKTAFICHDSFGNFPKNYKQNAKGAPAYRYVVADEIDEAIVFPHTPRVIAQKIPSGVAVSFVNRAGHPLQVRKAMYKDGKGKTQDMDFLTSKSWLLPAAAVSKGKIAVYVEADYYMKKGGKGVWLSVPLRKK